MKRGATAAGLLAVPSLTPSAVWAAPPSNRIAVGVIGRGAMGSGHVRWALRHPDVQLLAVCEVDRLRREQGQQAIQEQQGDSALPTGYNDYRDLLARPDLDAVIVVTPDHWHALMSIDAAKAGKDVYCEKPISLTIEEGRCLAETMQRYDRVFQTGTQYRSIPTIRRVVQFVREGGLGRVKSVFTLLNRLDGFLRAPPLQRYAAVVNADANGSSYIALEVRLPGEPVPEGLDWDLWVGPAPWRPYNPLYHVNPSPGVVPWAFCEDFGVASLTWHLAHSADVIQYALGMEESGPVEIIHPSSGSYPTVTCRYANGTLLHFVDHWGMVRDVYHAVPPTARLAGNFGGVFVGERGWITSMSTGGPVEGGPDSLFQELNLKTREVNIGDNDHHANWLECIRTRRRTYCDGEIGHRTACVGHLATVACKLGRSVRWDPVREIFPDDPPANALRTRAMRPPWHL